MLLSFEKSLKYILIFTVFETEYLKKIIFKRILILRIEFEINSIWIF